MKRRNFLKILPAASVTLRLNPWKMLSKAASDGGIDTVRECTVNVAHVEADNIDTVKDLYLDHALLCQEIHNWSVDKVAQTDVPVELLRINPHNFADQDVEKLKKLDVFSVSTAEYQMFPGGSKFDQAIARHKDFWKKSDALGVYAAGNDGRNTSEKSYPKKSSDDFSDASSLTVGEAGKKDGEWYLKATSENTGHVSLVCSNPMDEGERFTYFNQSPSLIGKEDYIIRWIQHQDAAELAAKEFDPQEDPENYRIAKDAHWYRLINDASREESLQKRAAAYIENPQTLHDAIVPELRKEMKIGADNKIGGLEGSSFAAPVVAGAISAAKYMGKLNACAGKPELGSQELVALALLSTDSVEKVGKMITEKEPMLGIALEKEILEALPSETNARGLSSSFRAGFGLFNGKKFQDNLVRAYKFLEDKAELKSIPQISQSEAMSQSSEDLMTFDLKVPKQEEGNTTILRLRLEYSAWFEPPPWVTLVSPQGTEYKINMAWGDNQEKKSEGYDPPHGSWGVTDRFFGEKAAGTWKIKFPNEGSEISLLDPRNMKLTLHGVREGGLVDKMIEHKLDQDKNPSSPERSESGGRHK